MNSVKFDSSGVKAVKQEFLMITPDRKDLISDITAIFNRILEPLYGSQKKALDQIVKGEDRRAYLLYEDSKPVGVIAFKTELSDEFKKSGIKKSVEIKSLFLVDPKQHSGKGLGTLLLNKVVSVVKSLGLGQESFHVTVSESKEDSLAFFLHKGFQIVETWDGKYQEGKKEHLLAISSQKIEKAAQKIFSIDEKKGSESSQRTDEKAG